MNIKDLTGVVADKLRGRTDLITYGGDLGSDIPSWIIEAVWDITPDLPFEELIVPGPFVNFIVGQAEYPVSFFLDPNNKQDEFTDVRNFTRYFSTDIPPALGQPSGELKVRASSVVQSRSNIPGLPSVWCQNGSKLLFGFNPDQPYTVFMRFQKKHPFVLRNNLNGILSQTVFMPNDWREIIAYAAAIKGCDYLGMNDIGTNYFQKLHGDPKRPADLGILKQKATQLQRNLNHNERQLQPVVRRIQ